MNGCIRNDGNNYSLNLYDLYKFALTHIISLILIFNNSKLSSCACEFSVGLLSQDPRGLCSDIVKIYPKSRSKEVT